MLEVQSFSVRLGFWLRRALGSNALGLVAGGTQVAPTPTTLALGG